MKKVLKTFDKAMNDIGKRLVKGFRGELEDQNSIATGKLFFSLKENIQYNVDEASMIITTDADYVDIVNNGMKSGTFPNLTAIKKWMDAKGIDYSDENEKEAIAFNIAKRIAIEGLPTKGGIQKSKNGRKTNFIGIVAEAYRRTNDNSIHKAIGQDIDNIFKKLPKQI
jgi:hypothetical protein|tara:strand:+ start:547 stop:1050 length:504 start_codon:yes stop_codon:yes gene_type:complete